MDIKNKTFWEEFIELYREHKCLWDVKSKDYANKIKRNSSYEILLHKFKELFPTGTIDVMKKKINNIRTSFRRELKKVVDSKRTGTGTDDIYETSLWYFDLMLFTAENETGRKGKSNDDEGSDVDTETNKINFSDDETLDSVATPDTPAIINVEESSTDNPEDISQNIRNHHSGSTSPCLPSTSIIRKRCNPTGKKQNDWQQQKIALYNVAHKALTDQEDEFDIIGKRFAFQLQKLNDRQRVIAEKLWADIMFHGAMGKLEEDCTINFPSKNLPQPQPYYSLNTPTHPTASYQSQQHYTDSLLRSNLSDYVLLPSSGNLDG